MFGPDFVITFIVPFLRKRERIALLYLYSWIDVGVYVLLSFFFAVSYVNL